MIKYITFVLLLVALTSCYHVRQNQNHNYWYSANRKIAQSQIPYTDGAWNYCDYKCISLQKLTTAVDFYVVTFRQSAVKPNFSVCYGKNTLTGQVKIWKDFINNQFYQKNCGSDDQDFINSSKYTKISQEGVGKDSLFTY